MKSRRTKHIGKPNIPRKDWATKNLETGCWESKGKVRRTSQVIPEGAQQQINRQIKEEDLRKEAGLVSAYLHETTLSKPFGKSASRTSIRSGGDRVKGKDKSAKKTEEAKCRKNIDSVRLQILNRDNYTCRYCGTKKGPFHIDHVIPWSEGGPDTEENLVTACKPCNLRKGTKHWIPKAL